MSMFQILTQEGWIDVMQDTMKAVSPEVRPFVSFLIISDEQGSHYVFITHRKLSMHIFVIV